MSVPAPSEASPAFAPLLSWPRLRFTLVTSGLIGLVYGLHWESGVASALVRTVPIGLAAMLVFGVFERWPKRLPTGLARWVWQVIGVALSMPVSTFAFYWLWTKDGARPFWEVPARLDGFVHLTFLGLLIGPWAAFAALVRQKDALVRHQRLAFDLQRSELERQALDARLRLLQGQVAPHFLFNTLANVQALVETDSPEAPAVLRSLVAYLRAAVPRLEEPVTTLGQELELVRAYLELMRMRMPDRLTFAVRADDAALALPCPPMTLLTLVENAVRHGIDPSEEGGSIEIDVERRHGRCLVRVGDPGVGVRDGSDGFGTGLATLRQRLQLVFGEDAHLRLTAGVGGGVVAELDLPAVEETRG
jgi:hypothetical protein